MYFLKNSYYISGPDFFGSHPGDWEYMEIFFDKEKPYQYNFSNHNGARNKSIDEVKIINTHVQVGVVAVLTLITKHRGH